MGLFKKPVPRIDTTQANIEQIKESVTDSEGYVDLPKINELPKTKDVTNTAKDMLPLILEQLANQKKVIEQPKQDDTIKKSKVIELIKELDIEIKARQEAMTLLSSLI